MNIRRINKTAATEIALPSGYLVLYSYNTPVAVRAHGNYFRTSKKWSVTTSKHINRWLEGVKATEIPQEQLELLLQVGQESAGL